MAAGLQSIGFNSAHLCLSKRIGQIPVSLAKGEPIKFKNIAFIGAQALSLNFLSQVVIGYSK